MKSINELSALKSVLEQRRIEQCYREFPVSELDWIPEECREEEADGKTCLLVEGGSIIAFSADSENFSITYEILDDFKGLAAAKEVTGRPFWKKRVGSVVTAISPVMGHLTMPYGVCLELENGLDIKLCYVSESEYEFDALVIRTC